MASMKHYAPIKSNMSWNPCSISLD